MIRIKTQFLSFESAEEKVFGRVRWQINKKYGEIKTENSKITFLKPEGVRSWWFIIIMKNYFKIH